MSALNVSGVFCMHFIVSLRGPCAQNTRKKPCGAFLCLQKRVLPIILDDFCSAFCSAFIVKSCLFGLPRATFHLKRRIVFIFRCFANGTGFIVKSLSQRPLVLQVLGENSLQSASKKVPCEASGTRFRAFLW